MPNRASEDILSASISPTATSNPELTLAPTLWFYNRWKRVVQQKPSIDLVNKTTVRATHERLGDYYFYFQPADKLLFTEKRPTNTEVVSVEAE